MKKLIFFFIPLLFIVACNTKNQSNLNTHQLKTTQSRGIWQNPDSFAKPISIPDSKPISILAGKPTINPTNLNVHIAGQPTIIIAGKPKVNTPGTDTFSLPKIIPVFFALDTASTSLSFGEGPRVRSNPPAYPKPLWPKTWPIKTKTPQTFLFLKYCMV